MPAAAITRDEAVDRILSVFRQHGYEGASLARLAEATGLGRSSLYHHFPKGKEDMANAALTAVGVWFRSHILSTLNDAAPPREKLQQFAARLDEFYHDEAGLRPCLMDVFTIGEAGAIFQKHLGIRLQAMMRALATVAEEAGVGPDEAMRRAENAAMFLHGALVVSRALGNKAPFQRMIREFPDQLLHD